MAFRSGKLKELFRVPRSKIIWIALILFIGGAVICSFNPPAEDGQQNLERQLIMNNQSELRVRIDNIKETASSELETATFALG